MGRAAARVAGARLVRVGRRALVVAALAVAAAAGTAALVLVLVGSESRGGPVPRAVAATGVAGTASITPRVHLFGDSVIATVDLLVDRERVDPDGIRLRPRFTPYERVGQFAVARRDLARLTQLRYRVVLRCLTAPCVPERAKQSFSLPPLGVHYRAPGGTAEPRVATIRWPRIEAASRVNESALVPNAPTIQLDWRADLSSLPQVSYRAQPRVLAAALAGGGVLLLVAAGGLAFLALRRRPTAPAAVDPYAGLPPLERALALLESARARGDAAEQRKALDLLAAELGRRGGADLAGTARELAWSRSIPGPDVTETLSGTVRGWLEQRRNGHGG